MLGNRDPTRKNTFIEMLGLTKNLKKFSLKYYVTEPAFMMVSLPKTATSMVYANDYWKVTFTL